jgi:hypothetical protein
MRRLEKVKVILQQFQEIRRDFPEIRRIEALKRAIAKVKFLEENKYDNNDGINHKIGGYTAMNKLLSSLTLYQGIYHFTPLVFDKFSWNPSDF